MYIVKNTGAYPVIIRDLSLHIAGGKTVDLDTLFKPNIVRMSGDLISLVKRDKLSEVDKEVKPPDPVQSKPVFIPQKTQSDSKILTELLEIKKMLKSGVTSQVASENTQEDHDEETLKMITDMQVKNLSGDVGDVKKNFEQIGESTNSKGNLDQLLDVLDSLEEKGE